MYNKKVMQHFLHPHNMGNIKNADGVGEVGNLKCGDVMKMYIKVKNNKITNIKFETFGCAAAISTSSMITELAKGKTIEQAMQITRKDVADELGGLPLIKMHCSNLAADALHAAIKNYQDKLAGKRVKKLDVCVVSKKELKMKPKTITKDTVLADVLNIDGAEEILHKFSLPCLHCPMAAQEIGILKLGDVAEQYGIDIDALLKELNTLSKK